MNLQEQINRTKKLMGFINERISNKIVNYFEQNNFFKGVFPHTGYETNEFVKPLRYNDDLAINLNDVGFFLQVENREGDPPDAFGDNPKVGGLVVASDPELENNPLHSIKEEVLSWRVHVFLVKAIFTQEKVNRILGIYTNLKLSTNCLCENSIVYCLTGTMSKEDVVSVANSVSEGFWVGGEHKQTKNIS